MFSRLAKLVWRIIYLVIQMASRFRSAYVIACSQWRNLDQYVALWDTIERITQRDW